MSKGSSLTCGSPTSIAVMGAGSWGTALARRLALINGHVVRLWEYDSSQVERLIHERENKKFLPGVAIPEGVSVTSEPSKALEGADAVVLVLPSHVMRGAVQRFSAKVPSGSVLVNCAKGLEEGTLLRMSEIIHQVLPEHSVVTLSGPSHAEEVGRDLPTTLVAASLDEKAARFVQGLFMAPSLRVYTSSDIVGVELGGSLKNPIAIAAGAASALGFGDNAMGALITRGAAEIARLATAAGGQPQTVMGLAGVGDLITTCISRHSRNRHVGEGIGRGQSLDEILGGMVMVAEGVRTSGAVLELARRYNVEMPITQAVHDVLFHHADPCEAVIGLMTRAPKSEGI